jgi:hypothetical protein
MSEYVGNESENAVDDSYVENPNLPPTAKTRRSNQQTDPHPLNHVVDAHQEQGRVVELLEAFRIIVPLGMYSVVGTRTTLAHLVARALAARETVVFDSLHPCLTRLRVEIGATESKGKLNDVVCDEEDGELDPAFGEEFTRVTRREELLVL